ncbi:MAG: hypothetical protein NE334_15950 [Lentisphaeraceae bacterium]|nr:hypothetical protein [Lentisphaeraceae bacterium]
MKYLLIFLSISLSLQAKDISKKKLNRDAERSREIMSLYTYVAKFIEKVYIEPGLKEIPKLEKKAAFYKSKANSAKTAKAKEKYINAAKEAMIEIEVYKLWPQYVKAYSISRESYLKKDTKVYQASLKVITQIKNKYKALTSNRFPNVEGLFHKKYPKFMAKINEKYAPTKQ